MIVHPHAGDAHDVLGTTATIKLSSADTDGRAGVTEHTVPLNAGPPPHAHQHQDELFYVLDGTFDFVLGDPAVRHTATPGTWVHVPAGTIHASRGTSPLGHLLSIYLPAGGEQFFRELDIIDQTDPNAVQALAARHDMTFPAPVHG